MAGQPAMSPSARPLSEASRANRSAPSAIRSDLSPNRSRAVGPAAISSPSALKIAAGHSISASSRCARSGKLMSSPARSVATTSTAGVLSASTKCEQRQGRVPSEPAPNPRSRSSRAAPPCGSVPARRRTCAAAACSGIETDGGERARRCGVEDRSRARVGPQHARRVRAPEPYRQRAQGMSREPLIAQESELEFSPTHCARRIV